MLWQAHCTEKRPLEASVLHSVHNTTTTCLAYSTPFFFISLSFFFLHYKREMVKRSHLLIAISRASIFYQKGMKASELGFC